MPNRRIRSGPNRICAHLNDWFAARWYINPSIWHLRKGIKKEGFVAPRNSFSFFCASSDSCPALVPQPLCPWAFPLRCSASWTQVGNNHCLQRVLHAAARKTPLKLGNEARLTDCHGSGRNEGDSLMRNSFLSSSRESRRQSQHKYKATSGFLIYGVHGLRVGSQWRNEPNW